MRRLAALIFFIITCTLHLQAQTGQDWINYSQRYAKLTVAKNGLYRVTADQLTHAGFSIQSAAVANLQLFHRGNEQAIIVEDDGDGVFNNDDYLEFFGFQNDGTLDQELYSNPAHQPHQSYNLFSDTTAYFLTVGAAEGKRANFYADANSGLTAESFHYAYNSLLLAENFATGLDYGQIHLTTFDQGEGWMSSMILYNQSARLFTIENIANANTSQKPKLEAMITGRGPKVNPVAMTIGPSARPLANLSVTGFETKKVEFEIEWSDIANGTLPINVKVTGDGTRASINYFKLIYPQQFNMADAETFEMHLPENSSATSYVEIANAPLNTRLFDITTAGLLTEVGTTNATSLQAVVRNTTTARRLFATNSILTPLIKPVVFRNINPAEHNYVIITHPLLQKAGGGYGNAVKAFAAYRTSPVGGGYDTLIVNIGSLYDQFSYGEQTPLAIFHFMKYLAQVRLPDYLLIIGKGLDVSYNYHRNPATFTAFKDLVPTAGYPGSDIAYTAGLGGPTFGPAVATGRISAMNAAEVSAYLDKLKESESRPFDDLRRKHVLHLSGGVYAGEPQAFRGYLEEFEPIAEDRYLGGKVSAVAKQSTDLQLINIAEEVNKGLGLITFFGHSSPGVLDFDIGKVTDDVMGYHNKGKYPVLLMNGCDAGAFFLNQKLFGEDWINAKDRGAIAFIAHSSLGFIHHLRRYSKIFYEVGFGDSVFITKGIGDIQKEVIKRYTSGNPGPIDITHIQNMVLLGDPAARLFGARHADYAIEDNNLSITAFDEDRVTTAADSFAINFIVKNYGQAVEKPLRVEVSRTLSDRSVIVYDSIYSPVMYSDTLQFIIRGHNSEYAGANDIAVKIDHLEEVDELREDNNVAYINFFLAQNTTLNLYPSPFAIVNQKALNLAFQHTNLLSDEREYLLEIDTTNAFISGFKQSFEISAKVLALQPVTLLDYDTTVYFWRTKLKNPVGNESPDWTTSSFTYINNGPEGWAQSNFAQLYQNEFTGLVPDPTISVMEFEETETSVAIKTFGATINAPSSKVSVKINDAEYNLQGQGYGCRMNALNLIAFDKNSTAPYAAVPLQWFNRGARACGREPFVINNFIPSEMAVGNFEDLIQYVDNVHPGDSVILFSMGDADYAAWPEAAKNKLGELGIASADIDALSPGEPVIIYGKKGTPPGYALFMTSGHADPQSDSLHVAKTITGRFDSGYVTSSLIGPADAWEQLIFKTGQREAQDELFVDIIGQGHDGREVLLFDSVAQNMDISTIDAATYPHLRLIFRSKDQLNVTSAQLEKWLVTFEPVREGLLFYKGTLDQSSLIEGQPWVASFDFINISGKAFDASVPVTVKIFNHEAHESVVQSFEIDPPAAGDTTSFAVNVGTLGLAGMNDLEVFANPKIIPEQYFHNNVISLADHINVTDERFNPVLDVTVDGRHIRNEEYVRTSPLVHVKLWDENPYIPVSDTTGLEMFIAHPCEGEPCAFKRINFSASNVEYAPVDGGAFLVSVQLANLADGVYALRVEATDESGNVAGPAPYEISFTVKSELTIGVSDLYPNPVEERIYVDVELSGDEVPYTNLDIFSVNGSFAYELREADFENLQTGFNHVSIDLSKSDIPAGIYLYRLRFIGGNGVLVEKRGKLVITR